jgi:hypothetical protein
MKMKIVWKTLCLLICLLIVATVGYSQKMDKAAFYAAMTSGSKEDIEKELAILTDNEQAYAGALIIRKAGLPKAKERLKLFKEGKAKLETALANEPDNAEYHFLRLSIQEHAPKIVKYTGDLQADKAFVIKHFDKLSLVVQRAVKEYSKQSTVLKPEEL